MHRRFMPFRNLAKVSNSIQIGQHCAIDQHGRPCTRPIGGFYDRTFAPVMRYRAASADIPESRGTRIDVMILLAPDVVGSTIGPTS
jgi:hypothetical protein